MSVKIIVIQCNEADLRYNVSRANQTKFLLLHYRNRMCGQKFENKYVLFTTIIDSILEQLFCHAFLYNKLDI